MKIYARREQGCIEVFIPYEKNEGYLKGVQVFNSDDSTQAVFLAMIFSKKIIEEIDSSWKSLEL